MTTCIVASSATAILATWGSLLQSTAISLSEHTYDVSLLILVPANGEELPCTCGRGASGAAFPSVRAGLTDGPAELKEIYQRERSRRVALVCGGVVPYSHMPGIQCIVEPLLWRVLSTKPRT